MYHNYGLAFTNLLKNAENLLLVELYLVSALLHTATSYDVTGTICKTSLKGLKCEKHSLFHQKIEFE